MPTELYRFDDGYDYYYLDAFLQEGHYAFKGFRNCREYVHKKGFKYGTEYFIARKTGNYWASLNWNKISFKDKVFLRADCFDPRTSTAPPIIKLETDESLRDKYGNVKRIEVRGERSQGNIYFKGEDVGKCLGIKCLVYNIAKTNSGYAKETHYDYFHVNSKKVMFLTDGGFLKAINSSTNVDANTYWIWVANILKMQNLNAKESGTKIDNLIDALNRAAPKIAAIYVLNLGYVRNIKKKLSISDDYDRNFMVRKFGKTDDLARRLGEHRRDFKNDYDIDISVCTYYPIDVKYIAAAETKVKHYLSKKKHLMTHSYHVEFFASKQKDTAIILAKFDKITARYSTNSDSLIAIHAEEKKKLTERVHNAETKAFDSIIAAKDYIIASKDLEIKVLEADKRIDVTTIDLRNLELKYIEMEQMYKGKIKDLERQLKIYSKVSLVN